MSYLRNLLTLCILAIVSNSFAQTNCKTQAAVFFESAKFDLSDSSKIYLKALTDTLKAKLKLQISISGNTDDVGDSVFNSRLSENRSREVRRFFIDNGLDSIKLKIGYNGENKPMADNASDMGKQKNRRVDIAIKWEIPKPPEPKGDVRELLAQLTNPVSNYCINNRRDTVLYTANGSGLLILSNAFGDEKACKEDCINIEFKDALNQADMIFDNLTTFSNGILLESGGMAFMNAKCGKKNLRIKSPNSMFLILPADTLKDDMKVFFGLRNTEIEPMNWNVSKKDKVWTIGDDFHTNLHDQLLAYALKNRKKGCLGIGGMSKKKIAEQIKARSNDLQSQMSVSPEGNSLSGSLFYIASVSKMGWVSCDRFSKNKTAEYSIATATNPTTASYIAAPSINALIYGTQKDKKFVFIAPQGFTYKFVGLKYEDKKIGLATLVGNTSETSNPIIYKPYDSVTELKDAIKAYFTK